MVMSQRLIGVVTCVMLGGCITWSATANVVVTPMQGPVDPISRVYVTIEQRTLDASFTAALGTAICREFERYGMPAKFRALNGLSSDERDALGQARQWQADARLKLDFVGGVASSTGFSTVVYSADLFHQEVPKPVWHARVRSEEGSFGSTQGMMDAAARSLVNQLQHDGWLGLRRGN